MHCILTPPENAHGLGSLQSRNRPLSAEPFGAGQVGFMQARPEALGDPGRERIEMGLIAPLNGCCELVPIGFWCRFS
jgi:hypothetical protein